MIIGNFTHSKARDTFTGAIETLTVPAREVTFQPNDKGGEKAPDYRVLGKTGMGSVELGAAWKRSGENGEYLSVKLDDPALAQSINCALVGGEGKDGFILVWSRDNGGRKAKAA
jgi:uncharacterized protein (DUF736 family)